MPDCLKSNQMPEPAVSYHASDEEVQLRAMPDCLYQDATAEVIPPPPNYSSLPQGAR